VWRYDYNSASQTVSNEQVVVKNMYPSAHSTRTLVVPPATPNLLVVSLGSDGNLDGPAVNKATGRALVKTFDISTFPSGGYDYPTQGRYLGYGLRNEVALAVDGNNMLVHYLIWIEHADRWKGFGESRTVPMSSSVSSMAFPPTFTKRIQPKS
jgi:glucose/arabinose dehydrogenase